MPGAIPNWFGAPVVKLLDETPDLFPAPVCKNKGAAVRLYDNTCRCARGQDATDYTPSGQPRGNCTGWVNISNHFYFYLIVPCQGLRMTRLTTWTRSGASLKISVTHETQSLVVTKM